METEDDSNMNVPNKKENLIDNKEKNYIIAEINIDKNNINKEIRLINSFEKTKEEKKGNYFREIKRKDYYNYENEEEIKDNCEIKINNKKIEFSYFYKFEEEGY